MGMRAYIDLIREFQDDQLLYSFDGMSREKLESAFSQMGFVQSGSDWTLVQDGVTIKVRAHPDAPDQAHLHMSCPGYWDIDEEASLNDIAEMIKDPKSFMSPEENSGGVYDED